MCFVFAFSIKVPKFVKFKSLKCPTGVTLLEDALIILMASGVDNAEREKSKLNTACSNSSSTAVNFNWWTIF